MSDWAKRKFEEVQARKHALEKEWERKKNLKARLMEEAPVLWRQLRTHLRENVADFNRLSSNSLEIKETQTADGDNVTIKYFGNSKEITLNKGTTLEEPRIEYGLSRAEFIIENNRVGLSINRHSVSIEKLAEIILNELIK